MRLRNLTPHPIALVGSNGTQLTLLPEAGPTPRVDDVIVDGEPFEVDQARIPTSTVVPGAVADLPAPQHGVSLIVSRIVAARVPERDDVFFPHDFVRDEEGNVVGARALGRIGNA